MKTISESDRIKNEYSSYLKDESNLSGFSDKILIIEDPAEINDIIRNYQLNKIPVTVSNGRTGTTGGCVPLNTDLLTLERLNKVKDMEKDTLTVESGISLQEIESFLEKENPEMFYPVDVTESTSRIGGNIATDASGSRSFFYGSTRDWILACKIVLPDGRELEINRGTTFAQGFCAEILDHHFTLPDIKVIPVKNTAGYYIKNNMDLIDLFIGSEGTLGIITQVKLKLSDRVPGLINFLCFFPKEENALNFFKEIISWDNLYSIEFFDKHSIQILSEDLPLKGESALYFEIQDPNRLEEISRLIQSHHSDLASTWMGENNREKNRIRDFRHKLPEKINALISERKRAFPQIHKIGTDIAIPFNKLSQMIDFYYRTMQKETMLFALFGHIGEAHLHLNMIPDNRPQFERAKKLHEIFIRQAVSWGGTFAAEHGVGKIKKPFMKYLFTPEEIDGMAAVKKTLDPNLILNPGVMF
ncbi:MAG: FAD-binding oxidoreductase [Spirochaetes bacterium]|nr:FAD-binding oxidoreductase [Spirochaetota bacterium]